MLIGRQREHDVLMLALQQRAGGAIFLAGEAGIGKSALLAAVRSEAARLGYAVAFDVAPESGWVAPYRVWASLLTQIGQPADRAMRVEAALSPEAHRLRVHRDVVAAIRDAAKLRPVVLSLDDVQWLDQGSRDLLVHAIRELEHAPVLLIGSWRTPISERDGAVLADMATMRREPGIQWLDLAGLEAGEASALAAQLGAKLPPAAVRDLMTRTQGNPFFVSEIARLMTAHGTVDGEALAHQVPPSVRQVVRQRFLGLPEETRQMLGVAAIFPRGFDFALLREVIDLDEDVLLDAVDDALDRDFLRHSERRAEHYVFAHDIVREAIAVNWSSSRKTRLHRRAAEALEQRFADRLELVAGDLALQYAASRSLPGAERGVVHALAGADQAAAAYDFTQAAAMLEIAQTLAEAEPLMVRADIAWRLALALSEALRIDEAESASERAVAMLQASDTDVETVAAACWQLASSLNAVGAKTGVRDRVRDAGLRALGGRRDLAWARLRLLSEPIEVVPHDVLYVARWIGFDPEAQRLARQQGSEEDGVQTIESFDPRTLRETRGLLALARSWQQPRSTLRGLTGAANDLTYRHGEFRLAMRVWNEVLDTARRIGAIPWQANALNQITLLHVALGEFPQAVSSKHEADAVNATLGPANDAEALLMERDFALSHYLDGDWAGQAAFWLGFVGDPPTGLETQLAVPLYAAMAASSAAAAGVDTVRALRLVDALIEVAPVPGVQQVNGVVAWAADAVFRLSATDRARALDRLAAELLEAGIGDYPLTSLYLTRARMQTLLGESSTSRMFDLARETLASQGQLPLLGITCFEQATTASTSVQDRKRLLEQAIGIFQQLTMTSWHERATAATAQPLRHHPDLAGVTGREVEVLRLVAQGYSDRRVADTLFISERTVNAHVRNILRKTETGNRTELSSWAQAKGLLELTSSST